MVVDRAKCLPVFTALINDEKINTFVNLCSIIGLDEGSLAEIQLRIVLSQSTMIRLRDVRCNNKITRKTWKRQIQSLVLSVSYMLRKHAR